MIDYSHYNGKPYVIDAAKAHANGIVKYKKDGTILFNNGIASNVVIPLTNQFGLIFSSFLDLNKALSQVSNSPRLEEGISLRSDFNLEFSKYRQLVVDSKKAGHFEPDYGSYVYDYFTNNLYLLLPPYWHRLALVTSPSKLISDPAGTMSWSDIRKVFDNAVIGIAGASVGGNISEGVLREIRPMRLKLADPDYWEITNLSRAERISIRHLVRSKALKTDPLNPFEIIRVNKAESLAYELNLVDPYLTIWVYNDGIHENLIEDFLLGNGDTEPKLDLAIEEIDSIRLKYDLRESCRKHKIPLVMLSDFGHRVQVQFQDFRKSGIDLGYHADDNKLKQFLDTALTSGNREDLFVFVRALCGDDFAADEFANWVKGVGEQPTSSLPQSGATALISGGIGGKLIAFFLLGYPMPRRIIFDFKSREVITD